MSNAKLSAGEASATLAFGILLILVDVALQSNGVVIGIRYFHAIPCSLWIIGAFAIVGGIISLAQTGE